MKTSSSKFIPLSCALLVAICLPAYSQVLFTGGAGLDTNSNYDYNVGNNWGGSVPSTSSGAHAVINDGLTATWYGGATDGGDFIIANGGELEVSNGGWQQVTNNNWIQLQGNATLLVDGGTFTQGTAGNNPFNIVGTGNIFTITGGTANFNSTLSSNSAGVVYNFNGGTVNINGEIDYNSNDNYIVSGSTINATLLTAVNSSNIGTMTIDAGIINLSSGNGIYAANATAPINFGLGSTGLINFEAVNAATVQGWANTGVFNYGNSGSTSTSASNFLVTSTGANSSTIQVNPTVVPEPSTYALMISGLALLIGLTHIRHRKSD